MVDVTVRIPDDLAERLKVDGDLSRRVLEAFAVDEYRHRRLTRPELQRLLGIGSSEEIEGFLKACGMWTDDIQEDAYRELRILGPPGL